MASLGAMTSQDDHYFATQTITLPVILTRHIPVRNWQRCTAPQNRFKIAVQLNYSCLAAF